MPKYAKFLKGLLTNKARLEEACTVTINKRCLAVLLNKLPLKEKDLGSFTIPYDIGQLHINNALADLGASISLMPYTMYAKLGLGEPKLTRMSLELADSSIQYPRGIIKNVLIKVDKFVLLIDFVILDMPEDSRVPIILGRSFLANAQAMIDELLGNDKSDSFLLKGLEKSINQSDLESCKYLESKTNLEKPIQRIDSINTSYSLEQGAAKPDRVESEHLYSASTNEIDEKRPELKSFPHHLEYAYLHGNKSFPIIISSKLSKKEKMLLLQVLEKRKGVITWKMLDIKGISLSYYTHKILIEDDFKPVIQPQRTFAYRRIPFGLCNAPATFQRCMMTFFHDMVEEFMEVFMDDFLVFGKLSFYGKRRDCSRTQNVGIKRLLDDLKVTAAKARVTAAKQNLVLFSNLDEKYAKYLVLLVTTVSVYYYC
ncbi:DNA-directed DNA polymerase [Tanacetum coccineum]|uniref:DNA-directed DNA polymerase n=1 Tax=Tanacetum coccineum TaxID=301880 RepID=A0ABQ5G4Y0_9ASTR